MGSRRVEKTTIFCAICGNPFETNHPTIDKYCSEPCRSEGCKLKSDAWKEKNKERLKQKRKKYSCDNKDRLYKNALDWKEKNKEHLSAYRKEYNKLRKITRIRCILELGAKCSMCGIKFDSRNAPIFDFHHTDSTKKETIISRFHHFEKAQKELKKCILVCKNCHALIHWSDYK